MKSRVNIGALYAEATEQVRAIDPAVRLPADNPFTLDHLLKDDTGKLLARLHPPAAGSPIVSGL